MNDSTIWWDILSNMNNLPSFIKSECYYLSSDIKNKFISQTKLNIKKASSNLVKSARKQFDLFGRYLNNYRYIDDNLGLKTAIATEILKNSELILNSYYIDSGAIQENIYLSCKKYNKVTFELGWGQAKRDAGNIKTPSFNADASEFVSLTRLVSLINAIKTVLQVDVTLTIISGGTRFNNALFVNSNLDIIYNATRKRYLEWLDADDLITFESINKYYSNIEINTLLNKNLSTYSYNPDNYKFVLFNIDWHNIISSNTAPHGISLPDNLFIKYSNADKDTKSLIIRELIFKLIKYSNNIIISSELFNQSELIENINWINHVVEISTLKYCIIGKVTPRNTVDNTAILLTVIEKMDNPTIPTICMLGRAYGSNLPQHFTTTINKNKILEFLPFIHVTGKYIGIYFENEVDNNQPFLFTALDKELINDAMLKVNFVNGI